MADSKCLLPYGSGSNEPDANDLELVLSFAGDLGDGLGWEAAFRHPKAWGASAVLSTRLAG